MADEVYHKMSTDLRICKFDANAGELSAYVTTYKNTDVVNDVMAPGVLDTFISNFKSVEDNKLAMLWNHNVDEPMGEWTDFKSDSEGVIGTGQIYTETTRGADVRALIQRGIVGAVSVGFVPTDYEKMSNGGTLFKEIELRETSIVLSPANPKALILSAKNDDGTVDLTKLENILCDAGLSRRERRKFIHYGKEALCDAIASGLKSEKFLSQLKQNLRSI